MQVQCVCVLALAAMSYAMMQPDTTIDLTQDDPSWQLVHEISDPSCPHCPEPVSPELKVITRDNIEKVLMDKHIVLFWHHVSGTSRRALHWFGRIAESAKPRLPMAVVACQDYDDLCNEYGVSDWPTIGESTAMRKLMNVYMGSNDEQSISDWVEGKMWDPKKPMLTVGSLPTLLSGKRFLHVALDKAPMDFVGMKESNVSKAILDTKTDLGKSLSMSWRVTDGVMGVVLDTMEGAVYHLKDAKDDATVAMIVKGEKTPNVRLAPLENATPELIYDHKWFLYDRVSVPFRKSMMKMMH